MRDNEIKTTVIECVQCALSYILYYGCIDLYFTITATDKKKKKKKLLSLWNLKIQKTFGFCVTLKVIFFGNHSIKQNFTWLRIAQDNKGVKAQYKYLCKRKMDSQRVF